MGIHLNKKVFILALILSVSVRSCHAFTCGAAVPSVLTGIGYAVAAVTPAAVPATVLSVLTTISSLFGGFCTPASYLTAEDLRYWESEFVATIIKGFREILTRIERIQADYDNCINEQKTDCTSYSKKLIDIYEDLSREMAYNRFHFDSHMHYWKMESLAAYAVMELNVLNLLIDLDDNQHETTHKKNYGSAFKYYLKKGTEYYQKYVMEQFPKRLNGRASVVARKASLANLQPALIAWMEQAKENQETRNRLNMASNYSLDLTNDIFPQIGVNHDFMPEIIHNDDWVALKCTGDELFTRMIPTDSAWLSCHGAVDNNDWCGWRKCPYLFGNQDIQTCAGEWFQIQNTKGGEITFTDKVALKYLETRNYWLSYKDASTSTSYGPKYLETLWVSRCPGSTFTESDVQSCDKEVFSIHNVHKRFIKNRSKVRHGDYIELRLDNFRVKGYRNSLKCFIVKNNH